ncbi:hypothetical protein [Streptomyces sp. NPDC093223]|uniref:hypothetical protein n=1 Tax=Streptomyces sp. NPDC093223 TaxID=3366033 RepID=UPI0037FFA9DD
MSDDTDRVVCIVAQGMYADGSTGLDIAEMWISTIVSALVQVQDARRDDPKAAPTWGPEATPHVAARRIIARLLDAGWRPPDSDCLDLNDQAIGDAS